MRYLSVFFVVLSVVCFTAPCVVAQQMTGDFDERSIVPEDDPILKLVPEPTDPEHRDPLHCGACGAIAMEAVDLLAPVIERHRLEAAREGDKAPAGHDVVREYETVDAYEQLCDAVSKKYGLYVRGGMYVSYNFTKHNPETILRGGWMVSFLSLACEELMDEMEDELTRAIFTAVRNDSGDLVAEVRRAVCTAWEASKHGCDKTGIPIDKRRKDPVEDL